MVGEAGGYCVQFSKSEGRCTTILEALNLNCPVIVSDIEAFREMGINEEYGFILPIPFKHIPIDEIYSKKFNFKFKNEKDGYDKYLTKGKSKYVEEKLMRVKIIREVFDTVAKIHYVPKEAMINPKNMLDGYPNKEIGTIIDVNENRAKYIVASGYGIYVDEPKRTKSKKKVK